MRCPRARFLSARCVAVRGFALVLTLLLIFLMAVLVVAVFSTVGTETKASSASSSGQVSRQMADLAVQVVKSQLQSATTQGPAIAWASQPGMIRCYDNTGTETKWYKLYSAANMVQNSPSGGVSLMKADLPDQNYILPGSVDYGVFTDINSPVISADGSTLVYPVVDPRDALSISPNTNVAGFDIDLGNLPPGYQASSAASATNNPAAMPVRWMYVLKDGTLVPASATGTAGQVRIAQATRNNPVVGRIAFWTDDETSKLNINTAGDGTYFDSPRFNSIAPVINPANEAQRIADRQFAITPPAAQEWQRFVGHPAQTRLSYVLPTLAAMDSKVRSNTLSLVTPFLQWGGSQGGTVTIWDQISGNATLTMLPPNRQTPYASLDEWIFAVPQPNYTGTTRPQNTYPDGRTNLLTNDSLNRLHFFLSSTSEAPEVNLYGQPRVAIWPIHNDFVSNPQSLYTTALDRMIARASSLIKSSTAADRYYFTRADSTSPTADYDNIGRNQQLIEYLRALGRTAEPGYGGNFNAKYQADGTNQILTEVFDYVRSTNANDASLMSPDFTSKYYGSNKPSSNRPDYSYAKYRAEYFQQTGQNEYYYKHPGVGQVVPIYINNYSTKGFGRCYSISEVGLDFTLENVKPANAPTGKTWIVGNLYLGLYSPSMAPGNMEPDLRVVVEPADLDGMTVSDGTTSQNIFKRTNNRPVYSAIPRAVRWDVGNSYPFMWGGAAGPRELFAYKSSAFSISSSGSPLTTINPPVAKTATGTSTPYGFCGTPIMVSSAGLLTVPPQQLRISVYYSGTSATSLTAGEGYPGTNASLIQTITVNFPGYSNLPLPSNDVSKTYTDSSGNVHSVDLNYRFQNANYVLPNESFGVAQRVVNNFDTIRTMVGGYNGDLRLIAGQRAVPGTAFVKHPNYGSSNQNVNSFRMDAPGAMAFHEGAFTPTAELVQAVTYPSNAMSIIGCLDPATYPSLPENTGDWDNGLSIMPDGPFINKPDEPNSQYFAFSDQTSDYPYYTQGDSGGMTTAQFYSSPNRALASPVMFGSLPTGIPIGSVSAIPWRTLLFRPQKGHFGASSVNGGIDPKDSLLLDWFWMPVVEPYAISTPMATSGKVNMNYQIAPFTYIKRATALMGVLGSEYVIGVPTSAGSSYKSTTAAATNFRAPIKIFENDNKTAGDQTGTLRQFREKFETGKIFTSASDICDIYLVPTISPGASGSVSWTSNENAESFWSGYKLTGDNSRERPYNGLYPRLTTKSNTFTVHVRAQALKAPVISDPTVDPTVWRETSSVVQSEYRGSVTINRYLDPEDASIPDFAAYTVPSNGTLINDTLDKHYKYRVLETRRFLP